MMVAVKYAGFEQGVLYYAGRVVCWLPSEINRRLNQNRHENKIASKSNRAVDVQLRK